MFGSKFAMFGLLLVLVGAGVFPFIDFGQGPLLKFSDIKGPKMPDIDIQSHLNQADRALDRFSSDENTTHQEIIRWQDENGQWHFSDFKPDTGQPTDTVSINLEQNVIQAFQPPPEPEEPKVAETEQQEAEAQKTADPELPDSPLDLLPSPDNVKDLMNSANNVQPMLEQRKKQQDALINGRF